MLTELEKKIIASIQEDMAVTERPYLKIAQKLDISETQLLEKLKDLCNREVIRRFGATLRHQRTGFTANAMVAWKVDEDRIEAVGQKMARFRKEALIGDKNGSTDDGQWTTDMFNHLHPRENTP